MSIPIISNIDGARASILQRAPLEEDQDTAEKVATIVRDVRQRGDTALREWTQRLDGVRLEQFRVPAGRMADAAASLAPDLRAALQLAATELEHFHRHQVRNTWVDVNAEGLLGQMMVPLNQVGIYVPGGTAPLPSSLLHAAIPARVAGVSELIVCSPPQRDSGQPADLILAAAHIIGVQHVFALGGGAGNCSDGLWYRQHPACG
jgi:histidinol dehydrogenase (EC 1.1.1.23)